MKSRGIALRIVQAPPSKEYPNLDAIALQDMKVATVQSLDITKLIGSGLLHTKLWVVDNKHFYMGSANMDWRSLTQVSKQVKIWLCRKGLCVQPHVLFSKKLKV